MSAPPIVDGGELAGYFDFCWDTSSRCSRGPRSATSTSACATSRFRRHPPAQAAGGDPILLTNLTLRGGSPVQNTLVQFAQNGAHLLAKRGISSKPSRRWHGPDALRRPHMHGSAADADLRGAQTGR